MTEDEKEELYSLALQLDTLLNNLKSYNAEEEGGSMPTEIKISIKNAIDCLDDAAYELSDATEGLSYLDEEDEADEEDEEDEE